MYMYYCLVLLFAWLWCLAIPFTPPPPSVTRHDVLVMLHGRRWQETAPAGSFSSGRSVVLLLLLKPFSQEQQTETDNDDDTVLKLKFGDQQLVTLIGTAHLSKASNEQVTTIIESTRPDVVMVELDKSCLKRIGIASTDDLGLPYSTSDDIVVPLQEDDKLAQETANKHWFQPFQDLLLDVFTLIARKILTGLYDDMGSGMGDDMVGGGEFLAAINAAKKVPNCKKIILGDRDSMVTIRRAAELAVRSGDPLNVLSRLLDANREEMKEIQQRVEEENKGQDHDDNGTVNAAAMVEALKADTEIRTRIMDRLEKEVPEFHRAFLEERDYIMSAAIQREISGGAKHHVVAVVGLAHVPGIAENLKLGGGVL